jgi:probable HAF family extracellular repeat protein
MDRSVSTPFGVWKAALGAVMAIGLAACQSDSPTAVRSRPTLRPPSAALAVSGSDFELQLIGSAIITNGYGINDRDEAVGHRDGLPCASVGAYHCPTIWVPGQPEDVFLNLGSAPGGEAVDINNDGWVVGWNPNAFVWLSSTRQAIPLEGSCPRAFGINNLGWVVGQDGCSQAQAVLWQPTQPGGTTFTRVDLPLLPSPSTSAAYEINDAGQIIGQVNTPGRSYAVLWQPSSPSGSTYTVIDLGTLGGSSGVATDINGNGDIVGVSRLASGVDRAFRWTPDSPHGTTGVMSDLGALSSSSEALGINDDGIVVGDSDGQPVIWSAAGISTLPFSSYGYARAINNRGTIVGASGNLQTAIWRLRNRAPIARVAGPPAAFEGTAVTFDGTTSSDPDGDALTYAWTFGDGGSAIGPTPTHTYADNGPFPVTLTVTDAKGATGTTSVIVAVANVAPTITSLAGPAAPIQLVPPSASATVNLAFTDPAGAADTYAVRLDCGNGTIVSLSGAASPGTPVCSYTEAGVYTVRATVSDEDGGTSAEGSYRYVVVYDPTGGFVTGGGWIDSPSGACQLATACQSASGKASLGFVSKYAKGATTPTGNTEFQFNAGNLSFKSTSYQWLVVSGARAQYKGDGTINGSGDYGFLLTAIDGALDRSDPRDRFRIKIWDKATSATVYDNQLGQVENSDAATALGGGSIVIHSK